MSGQLYFTDRVADFVAGWVAGCAGVLVSHPFDTIKVRLQGQGVVANAPVKYTGTIHCLLETVRKEKVYGLFKGITPPLLGTAAWNALVFGVYGNTMKALTKSEDREKYSVLHTTIAGVAVAFAQSVIICPLELIKSRLQIQTDSKHRLYKGTFDCIMKIHRTEGVKGLFRGMGATIIRDIPGFVSYFNAYEILSSIISGKQNSDLGPIALLLAGGMAGTISWTLAFPPDVIKTRIQIDTQKRFNGFLDCLRISFKEERWNLFVRGLAPTLLRAFPMNAAIFTVYTMLMRIYTNYTIAKELDE